LVKSFIIIDIQILFNFIKISTILYVYAISNKFMFFTEFTNPNRKNYVQI